VGIPREHTEEVRAQIPDFLNEVQSAHRVLISTHLNPDGDALGSALACSMVLDQLGVANEVICHHLPPRYLQFLPQSSRIKLHPEFDDHDLGLILDLDSLERLGNAEHWFEPIERLVVIDHHVPHNKPGDLRIVDVEAPATASILCDLFFDMPGVEITPAIADCLLTGLLTDTGSFRFPNTTPHCLHIAGQLLEFGAGLAKISEEVYMTKAKAAVLLAGEAISRMHLACDERLAWTVLPRSLFEELDANPEDTEGIVNELLAIRTVEVAAIFREGRHGSFKVSLRARGDIDVAEAARHFGGGGHTKAAGLNVEGPQEEAEARVVEVLKKCLACS
jgi:phosphoesterase RecJ-like protein